MGSSIRIGVEAAALDGANAALVMTCDQPAVSVAHLYRLIKAGNGRDTVASEYATRKGVPAYFPEPSFTALRALQGDFGARDLLRHSLSIELEHGELDIDTEDKLQLARTVLLPGTV